MDNEDSSDARVLSSSPFVSSSLTCSVSLSGSFDKIPIEKDF